MATELLVDLVPDDNLKCWGRCATGDKHVERAREGQPHTIRQPPPAYSMRASAYLDDLGRGVRLELLHPSGELLKGRAGRDVIHWRRSEEGRGGGEGVRRRGPMTTTTRVIVSQREHSSWSHPRWRIRPTEDDALSSPIVGARQGPETLLA